jgi:hypothetical protein
MEDNKIYVKTHKNQWYWIYEEDEPTFNLLLEDYILSNNPSKFLKEFKDFRIESREEHKKANYGKK